MDWLFDFNLDQQLEYAVSVQNMYKKFRKKVIYEDVNLQIRPGECIGLVGENGSGKSTTEKLICGHLVPDGG
ncbi:MAG: ATP-binding cassette domain-containing protein, partial [Lachnospiraceae bacterium]|nr:ATP-binding cassette domain-containing protein [Lachnospiraceae bacterium]